MLARLNGILESVDAASGTGVGVVCPETHPGSGVAGPLGYEVMLPAATAEAMGARVGQRVSLRTFQYLEQQAQGASFIPRLVGFESEADERLFELLTKVKGLGVKRALRAMAAPTGEIAAAIAGGDVSALKGLPEIGKKLAETMILELKDKVGSLALVAGFGAEAAGGATRTGASPNGAAGGTGIEGPAAQQAISALVRLGEDRPEAETRVRAVLKEVGERAAKMTADEILAASFAVG